MSRKSMSKKLRFEVFKRDSFTCQYCGATPPCVILEVDHVIPVSKGGDNGIDNLVTSCFDCNRGKSNNDLTSIPDSIKIKMDRKKEVELQVKEYDKFLKAIHKRVDSSVKELGLYWFNLWEDEQNKYVFGKKRVVSVKAFLKRLSKYDIKEYMDLAYSQRCYENEDTGWRYFCGICWNKIRENERGEEW